jgi:hypothetical protein
MHTRLEKLLVVSMILEGDNLRTFGATPTTTDIPQALIGLYEILLVKRSIFPALRRQYAERVHRLYEDDRTGGSHWYICCYLKQ